MVEENQKKVPAKRIQLVDVVLERKGSQLFEGRHVRSPIDATNIFEFIVQYVCRTENAMVESAVYAYGYKEEFLKLLFLKEGYGILRKNIILIIL